MATFKLNQNEVTDMELGQLTIVLKPEAEFGQTEPHVYARHIFGKTVDGEFQAAYTGKEYLTGDDLYSFLAAFQDLAGRYFQFWAARRGMQGTVE